MQNVLLFSDKRVKAMNEKVNNLLSTIFLLCSQVALQSRDALGYSEFASAKGREVPCEAGPMSNPLGTNMKPIYPTPPPKSHYYSILLFWREAGFLHQLSQGTFCSILFIIHTPS